MAERYRLGGLGNDELLAGLSALVRREHALLSDFLAHLAELDERRLFLDLGYPSLFAYCSDALGLSKSSAGRRICAARVCRRYPEAFSHAARGELQLSVLCELSKYLKPSNATELFDACSHAGYEHALEILAARFPKPDVRDLIRRLPERSGAATPLPERSGAATPDVGRTRLEATVAEGTPPQRDVPTAEAPELPLIPAETAPTPARAARALEPLSPGRFGVHFTADEEFRDLLAEVRALSSHRDPRGDLLKVLKWGLEAYRRELQKARYGLGRTARGRAIASSVDASRDAGRETRSRHVPAAVSRAVYERDGGCCSFVSNDGRRCNARELLELDHVEPWALGGQSTVENLRLRCRAHNQHSARKHFGSGYMRAAVARSAR